MAEAVTSTEGLEYSVYEHRCCCGHYCNDSQCTHSCQGLTADGRVIGSGPVLEIAYEESRMQQGWGNQLETDSEVQLNAVIEAALPEHHQVHTPYGTLVLHEAPASPPANTEAIRLGRRDAAAVRAQLEIDARADGEADPHPLRTFLAEPMERSLVVIPQAPGLDDQEIEARLLLATAHEALKLDITPDHNGYCPLVAFKPSKWAEVVTLAGYPYRSAEFWQELIYRRPGWLTDVASEPVYVLERDLPPSASHDLRVQKGLVQPARVLIEKGLIRPAHIRLATSDELVDDAVTKCSFADAVDSMIGSVYRLGATGDPCPPQSKSGDNTAYDYATSPLYMQYNRPYTCVKEAYQTICDAPPRRVLHGALLYVHRRDRNNDGPLKEWPAIVTGVDLDSITLLLQPSDQAGGEFAVCMKTELFLSEYVRAYLQVHEVSQPTPDACQAQAGKRLAISDCDKIAMLHEATAEHGEAFVQLLAAVDPHFAQRHGALSFVIYDGNFVNDEPDSEVRKLYLGVDVIDAIAETAFPGPHAASSNRQ